MRTILLAECGAKCQQRETDAAIGFVGGIVAIVVLCVLLALAVEGLEQLQFWWWDHQDRKRR